MMPVRDQSARPVRSRGRFRQRKTWCSSQSPLQTLVDIMLNSLNSSHPEPPLVPMDEEATAPGPSLFDDNEFDDENLDAELEKELAEAPSSPDSSSSDDSSEDSDSSMTSISDTDRESFRSGTSTSTYSTDDSDDDSSLSSSLAKLQELTHSLGTATYSGLDMDEDSTMSFPSGSGRVSSRMSTHADYLERTGDDTGNTPATGEQNSQYGCPAGYYMEGNGEAATGYFDQGTDPVDRYLGRPAGYYLEDTHEAASPSPGLNGGQEQGDNSNPAGYYMEGGSRSPGYLDDEYEEPALAPALLGYYVDRTDDIVSAFHARKSDQLSADNAFVMALHNLP